MKPISWGIRMIDIDVSIVVEIVSILAMMALLNVILYKPVRKLLLQREAKISGLQEDIGRFEKNAQQLLDDYDTKLAVARKKGASEKETIKNEGRTEEQRLLSESTKEAEAKKDELLKQVSAEFEAAKKELQAKSEVFAADIAQKLLGRAV